MWQDAVDVLMANASNLMKSIVELLDASEIAIVMSSKGELIIAIGAQNSFAENLKSSFPHYLHAPR